MPVETVRKNEVQWRELLTREQFYVLQRHGTEEPGSSPLEKEFGPGIYHCAGCGAALYASEQKYDSSTGWPSFWAALPNATETARDWALFIPRIEVHCTSCNGHLGHIFTDGPPPTGVRHCINGAALEFRRR